MPFKKIIRCCSFYCPHPPHAFQSPASHQTFAWLIVCYALLTLSMLSDTLCFMLFFFICGNTGHQRLSGHLSFKQKKYIKFNQHWIKKKQTFVLILLWPFHDYWLYECVWLCQLMWKQVALYINLTCILTVLLEAFTMYK